MAIPPEREAEILRLYHAEKWRIGTIASQLGLHPDTVRRVLAQAGVAAARAPSRHSIVEPYIPFIIETLDKYPRLRASRLYDMVRARGYPGGSDHFRHIVSRYRPQPKAEAYMRLRTLPGEQAQVDWGHFGKVQIGRATRALMAFVMVLSWSRHIFLRFYLNAQMPSFLCGHVDAFEHFGGVPRVLLYDNLKSAVLERVGDAIRFNPMLLKIAGHYRFAPKPVAPARGNEKGRVERAIRYIRDRFFAARSWRDLTDLNAQALDWCTGIADDRRCPGDRDLSVREAFASEREQLLDLPDNPFPTEERVETSVGRTPYVRFDLNDYSVPHKHVRREVLLLATHETVRIVDGDEVIATHPRSWDRGKPVENPEHIAELATEKRAARRHRAMDRLHHAAPCSGDFLQRIAERGGNLRSVTYRLSQLLDAYGAQELEHALAEALRRDAIHLAAVRQVLEQRRHATGAPPPLPVHLPDDPRVRNLVVRPHALDTYDAVHQQPQENDRDHEDDDR